MLESGPETQSGTHTLLQKPTIFCPYLGILTPKCGQKMVKFAQQILG